MSFLKKLFGTKDNLTPEKSNVSNENNTKNNTLDIESKTSSESSDIDNIKIELSTVSRIIGLDEEFIDLIYFQNDNEKQKHRNYINSVLSELDIKPDTDFLKVKEKLIDYNNIDLEQPIPFLIESLLIENFDQNKDSNRPTETISKKAKKGIYKIQDYYSSASFISTNILLKLNSKQSDFLFEENLYNANIVNSDLNNFAKLASTYTLGHAFLMTNYIEKADHFFDRLEKFPFDLAPSTIAEYYRKIGELYLENGDTKKALKWLNAGLTLNPKLGVKKIITKLEAEK
jgi:tetratricopeptide (TPR) repeat protein